MAATKIHPVSVSMTAELSDDIEASVSKHRDKYKSRHHFILCAIKNELARNKRIKKPC